MFPLPPEIMFYVVLALAALALVLLAWNIRLEIKLRRLCAGKSGASLEDTIRDLLSQMDSMDSFRGEMEHYLTNVEKRLRRSVQGVEAIRFNPFQGSGSGGNQSFALALLNEDGDGVVLSSLYARDRTSVYSKPVRGLQSEHELTQEEEHVINEARQRLTSK